MLPSVEYFWPSVSLRLDVVRYLPIHRQVFRWSETFPSQKTARTRTDQIKGSTVVINGSHLFLLIHHDPSHHSPRGCNVRHNPVWTCVKRAGSYMNESSLHQGQYWH